MFLGGIYGLILFSPSFPRRRESRPSGNGSIQRLSESLEVLDSRFHGNDERLRESGLFGFGFF